MARNQHAVTYKDSKGKRHVELIAAETAVEAKKACKKGSVTVEGMGGKFVTVHRILKAERVG